MTSDPYSWDDGRQAPDWLAEWVRRMLGVTDTGPTEGTEPMTETQATTGENTPALTAQDRCDRCGAQALVLVCVPAADAACLMFCGHHAGQHAEALAQQGAVVLADDRASVK